MAHAAETNGTVRTQAEWTIDQLATRTALPVRTIREYQTLGIVPGPRKVGRIGLYGPAHVSRLELIGQLKDRGYSLAGIGDLLANWHAGADLAEVLGLDPDQLVHIDEPGAPATLADLEALLPGLVPGHLGALIAAGIIERSGEGQMCVPSPSVLQLARESLAAGIAPHDVMSLLNVLAGAADQVAEHVVEQLTHLPAGAAADPLLARGRGLLAHGIGRLTLHRVGRRLLSGDRADLAAALERAGAAGDR